MSLIFDIGTCITKAGLSTDSLPALIFPTVVGAPVKKRGLLKKRDEAELEPLADHIVGHDAIHNLSRCTLTFPLEHAVVKDWAAMEHLFNHCFKDLDVEPDAADVVLTEPPFNPTDCKERYAQTLFETFNCQSVAFVPQGVCALYASGRTNGVVLDSGEGVTHVTPIFDGYIINKAMNRINFGGRQITDHLRRLMFERGYNFNNLNDHLSLRKLKEETAYVAVEYDEELAAKEADGSEATENFSLPDGQDVIVGKERFRCTEIIFNPAIVHSEFPSAQELVVGSVRGCGIDIRKELLSNVVLAGGNTMFNGYAKRLQNEIIKLFPGLFATVNVIEAPDRAFSVWAGASVLVNLPSFSSNVITRDVYDEEGPHCVHNYQRKAPDDEDSGSPS